MAQFGGGGNKVPPWQRTQASLTSLLGQHPNVAAAAATIAGQLVMAGQQQQQQPQQQQQQQQQYAPVQQSIIQAPGLASLQGLAQQTLQQQTAGPLPGQTQVAPPAMVQNTLAQTSLMGQPPIASQPLQQLQQQQQQALQQQTLQQQQVLQQQQQQTQVATVQYPTPRALAPPTTFTNLPNTLTAPPVMGMPPTSTPNIAAPPQQQQQQPQRQRVFTGTITKLCADFGFVDDDVFFQTSCVIGQPPTVNDRVLVEATFNPTMPFKWNANRVQVIPGPNRDGGGSRDGHRVSSSASSSNTGSRQAGGGGARGDGGYNAVPPPSFAANDRRSFRDSGGSYNKDSFTSRSSRRSRSPRRRERDDSSKDGSKEGSGVASGRGSSKDKDGKRKRSRSRERSRSSRSPRSPARRRPRVLPRYNVQVPKILLQIEEANILELRKRYSNLYIPSDVFVSRPLWSNTFPAHRPFPFPKPVSFHMMHKEVDSVLPNDAVYDPPDASHAFAAKVMLLSVPAMEEIYRRSCALSEDTADTARDSFVHPTRLINFCVGLKGKNETMAIGGYWSPSLDGPNPEKDPSVLIKTATRTCMALTGVDLSPCTTWYRFAEIYYRRADSGHKGRSGSGGTTANNTACCCSEGSGGSSGNNTTTTSASIITTTNTTPTTTSSSVGVGGAGISNVCSSCGGVRGCGPGSEPGRIETTVLFLPDVWNISPTKLEWDGLHLNYKRQLDRKLAAISGGVLKEDNEADLLEDEDEEEDDQDTPKRKDPTHWSLIDIKNLKVVELRAELDARLLNSRGLRSQLIARLTKVLKTEQDKEEADKAAIEEKMKTDETLKKEEEEKKKEEEKRKKEEEEKKKEEEEKRRNLEKECAALEKRHTLPECPMILVHPSRSAKSGKFDATTMSLSVLLDYRQEDNKEHSFEVSLFAELFNEMLMRDFAFRIYRSLVEAPDKSKEEEKKKEQDKKKDDKEDKSKDKKDDGEKDSDKKRDVDKANRNNEDEKEEREPKRRRRDKFKSENDQKDDEEDAILDLDFEYEEEEFFKEDAKSDNKDDKTVGKEDDDGSDRKSDSRGRDAGGNKRRRASSADRSGNSSSKDKDDRKDGVKKKMVTVDPYLLLAFVYFDTTRTGYIVDRDLEDIINLLGLNLSRAQLKKLTSKVVSRDVLYYRKLTDVPVEDQDKEQPPVPQTTFLDALARGNRFQLPVFRDGASCWLGAYARRPSRGSKGEESSRLREGVVRYEGSLVDVSKLMQQLQRAEKALSATEDKLKTTQKELTFAKDESRRLTERNTRLSREVRSHVHTARCTEEELQRSMDDNLKYMTALTTIKDVIKPLVRGLEAELTEDVDVKSGHGEGDLKTTGLVRTESSEIRANGVSS